MISLRYSIWTVLDLYRIYNSALFDIPLTTFQVATFPHSTYYINKYKEGAMLANTLLGMFRYRKINKALHDSSG